MSKTKLTLRMVEPIMAACEFALANAQTYGARFKLREVLRTLTPHAQDLANEKQQLVDQYAEKNADGELIVEPDDTYRFGEHQAEVDRRWRELMGTEITIRHALTLVDVETLPASPELDPLELLLG